MEKFRGIPVNCVNYKYQFKELKEGYLLKASRKTHLHIQSFEFF